MKDETRNIDRDRKRETELERKRERESRKAVNTNEVEKWRNEKLCIPYKNKEEKCIKKRVMRA